MVLLHLLLCYPISRSECRTGGRKKRRGGGGGGRRREEESGIESQEMFCNRGLLEHSA